MDGSQCLNCVRSEIHNVLSTMRRNGRWASDERFLREIPSNFENPMIRSLKGLHDYLQSFDDINDVDAVAYLQPFLDVVAFPNTNGAMTGRALSSINKFLLYGAVTQESPRGREAINLAVASVVECKFEATNSYSDEVVLMQLLEVMVNLLRCPAGPFITDVNVWKMVETCARLRSEQGTSQLLRSTAANSLTHLILTLFSRSSELVTPEAIALYPSMMLDFDGPPDGSADDEVHIRSRRESYDMNFYDNGWDQRDGYEDEDEDEDGDGDGDGDEQNDEDKIQAQGEVNSLGNHTDENSGEGHLLGVEGEERRMVEALDEKRAQENELAVSQSNLLRVASSGSLVVSPSVHPNRSSGGNGTLSRIQQPIRLGNAGVAISALRRSVSQQVAGQSYGLPVLVKVLQYLAKLTDPPEHTDSARVFALQLINIVLESGGESLSVSYQNPNDFTDQGTSPIITVLQGDLCKHLLQNSQSLDLSVLSLTLRVIFNLFSAMKGHLKVQLEVFLTSVHLRIAESTSATFEQKELALESLLDFCREPSLMLDLYTNYDCDFRCTNLFERLCKCLCRCSIPASLFAPGSPASGDQMEDDGHSVSSEDFSSGMDNVMVLASNRSEDGPGVTVLEVLALEGVLAVIDAISRRCDPSKVLQGDVSPDAKSTLGERPPTPSQLASLESDAIGDGAHPLPDRSAANGGTGTDEETQWLLDARERSATLLRERKRLKRRLLLAARQFNKQPLKQYWLGYAQDLGVLPKPVTAEAVAKFLLNTPGLDMSAIGDYISEEPERKPFNNEVMHAFVKSFDFRGVRIDKALRILLQSFRLPGEAQKVDRLMEAFGNHLYEQNVLTEEEQQAVEKAKARKARAQARAERRASKVEAKQREIALSQVGPGQRSLEQEEASQDAEAYQKEEADNNNSSCEDSESDADESDVHEEEEEAKESMTRGVFRSADAAFVFAFSIIMLHTDLHNPNIPPEKKMMEEGFVRNNRGINDGENLPEQLLRSVFHAIKGQEMRMLYDPHSTTTCFVTGSSETGPKAPSSSAPNWDTVLLHSQKVNKASFTPRVLGRLSFVRAGVHERDMFLILFDSSVQAISVMLEMSLDGKMAARALEGFRNLGKSAVYFGLENQFNRVMITLCKYFLRFFPSLSEGGQSELDLEGLMALRDATLLSTQPRKSKLRLASTLAKAERYAASPPCRALLTFRAMLSMTKLYGTHIRESWRNFVQTLLALHDVDLLPSSFVEIDDVVDSKGHRLPTSAEGAGYQRPEIGSSRIAESTRRRSESRENRPERGGGFFSTLTSLIWSDEEERDELHIACKDIVRETLAASKLNIVFMRAKELQDKSLVLLLDALLVPLEDAGFSYAESKDMRASMAFERNSTLCIELLTEIALVCDERIGLVWPLVRRAFRQALVNANALPEGVDDDYSSQSHTGQLASAPGHESEGEKITQQRPAELRKAGVCSPFVVERVAVNILRIMVRKLDKPEVTSSLLGALGWLADLSDPLAGSVAARVGSGLSMVLRFQGSKIKTAGEWRMVCRVMDRFANFGDSVDAIWNATRTVVQLGYVNQINMKSVLEMLNKFIRTDEMPAHPPRYPPLHAEGEASPTPGGDPRKWTDERAGAAVHLIFEISRQVFLREPDFLVPGSPVAEKSAEGLQEAAGGHQIRARNGEYVVQDSGDALLLDRHKSWMFLVMQLRGWFTDNRPDVASNATQCLQDSLWSTPATLTPQQWLEVFDQVLFLLVEQTSRSQDLQSQRALIRATNILTRTFLHNVAVLSSLQDFHLLWLRLITVMSKALSQGETVRESALENLKNLIMVMQGEGHFSSPSVPGGGGGKDVWDLTWSVIEAQSPGVRSVIESALASMLPPQEEQVHTQAPHVAIRRGSFSSTPGTGPVEPTKSINANDQSGNEGQQVADDLQVV